MFLRGLRWSKVKICVTTTIYTHTGGLIRLYIVIWSVLSQFKWLLLFLHHAWRGHGARLSIRTKDPNNNSDTETGTLSNLAPSTYFTKRYFPHTHLKAGKQNNYVLHLQTTYQSQSELVFTCINHWPQRSSRPLGVHLGN